MIYENSRISVIVDDGTVVVDGEAYRCLSYLAGDLDPNVHSLQWVPDHPVPGHISMRQGGGSGGFTHFDPLKPYVEAWEQARDENLRLAAENQRQADEVQAKIKAEQDAHQARLDEQARALADRKAHDDALAYLGITDHEVLKVAEAIVARELGMSEFKPSDLAPFLEMLKKRHQAREIIKAERARLGIKT